MDKLGEKGVVVVVVGGIIKKKVTAFSQTAAFDGGQMKSFCR